MTPKKLAEMQVKVDKCRQQLKENSQDTITSQGQGKKKGTYEYPKEVEANSNVLQPHYSQAYF